MQLVLTELKLSFKMFGDPKFVHSIVVPNLFSRTKKFILEGE